MMLKLGNNDPILQQPRHAWEVRIQQQLNLQNNGIHFQKLLKCDPW